MIEREVLFYYDGISVQQLIYMVSVYKFGTVVPYKRRSNRSISFDGVDDYELHYFNLRDAMLEDRLRGHRFSHAYFKGFGLSKNSEVILSRCLQTVDVTPSVQLENIHSKVLEIPELIETYLWWTYFEWRENAV